MKLTHLKGILVAVMLSITQLAHGGLITIEHDLSDINTASYSSSFNLRDLIIGIDYQKPFIVLSAIFTFSFTDDAFDDEYEYNQSRTGYSYYVTWSSGHKDHLRREYNTYELEKEYARATVDGSVRSYGVLEMQDTGNVFQSYKKDFESGSKDHYTARYNRTLTYRGSRSIQVNANQNDLLNLNTTGAINYTMDYNVGDGLFTSAKILMETQDVVPEPSTIGILALSICGLMLCRLRYI